jgi:hypothetical protein
LPASEDIPLSHAMLGDLLDVLEELSGPGSAGISSGASNADPALSPPFLAETAQHDHLAQEITEALASLQAAGPPHAEAEAISQDPSRVRVDAQRWRR